MNVLSFLSQALFEVILSNSECGHLTRNEDSLKMVGALPLGIDLLKQWTPRDFSHGRFMRDEGS